MCVCWTGIYLLFCIVRPFNSNNNNVYCTRSVYILRWHMKLTITITSYIVLKNMVIHFRAVCMSCVCVYCATHCHNNTKNTVNDFVSNQTDLRTIACFLCAGKINCCIGKQCAERSVAFQFALYYFPWKESQTKLLWTKLSNIFDAIDSKIRRRSRMGNFRREIPTASKLIHIRHERDVQNIPDYFRCDKCQSHVNEVHGI